MPQLKKFITALMIDPVVVASLDKTGSKLLENLGKFLELWICEKTLNLQPLRVAGGTGTRIINFLGEAKVDDNSCAATVDLFNIFGIKHIR